MQKRLVIALAATLLLAGCSGLRFPGVYRIDIEQGNIVDDAMMGKLRAGMTESQVRFVMGSPQLSDPFEPDRWVYLYRLRRGSGELVENRIVLWFSDGKLARWEGQPLPAAARQRLDTSIRKTPVTPEPVSPAY
ncbi:MAG: outer membrane protein assembly factor BamE [Pseudomonadota bacterium]